MKITANRRSTKIGKEEVITYGKYNEIWTKNEYNPLEPGTESSKNAKDFNNCVFFK